MFSRDVLKQAGTDRRPELTSARAKAWSLASVRTALRNISEVLLLGVMKSVERVEFDDGSWIDIARSVTVMQRARWTKAATTYKTKFHGTGKKATTETDMDFDNEKFLMAFLTDIVKDTSAGPIDVAQLSEIASTRIREEFDRLNPDASVDEQIASLTEQLAALEELKNSDAGPMPTSTQSEDTASSPES